MWGTRPSAVSSEVARQTRRKGKDDEVEASSQPVSRAAGRPAGRPADQSTKRARNGAPKQPPRHRRMDIRMKKGESMSGEDQMKKSFEYRERPPTTSVLQSGAQFFYLELSIHRWIGPPINRSPEQPAEHTRALNTCRNNLKALFGTNTQRSF